MPKQIDMSAIPFPLLPTIATIPDEQIVGRDKEITQLLRLLRSQSVSVEELRRMGKSMLLLKMAYLCNSKQLPVEFEKENFKAKYFSFQGRQNLGEVIDLLIEGLKEFKEWHQIDFSKTYNVIREVFNSPKVEIGGVGFSLNLPEYKKSWKEIFFTTLNDIAKAQEAAGGKLILIFDELPIMLWDWYMDEKHEDAMEFLDILRERRQALEKQGIRFVYCGSIGIKIVLNTFRKNFKYSGEPTNEMAEFNLKPFSKEDSNFLCECFLLSEFQIKNEDKQECLDLAYELSNGLPFYISTLFNLLQTEFDYEVSPSSIRNAYELILGDAKQHKAFKQLIDRLEIYYPKQKNIEMNVILNLLSNQDEFLEEADLYAQVDIDDKKSLKESLDILLEDHYLDRSLEGGKRSYRFKYQIFKKWWQINRA